MIPSTIEEFNYYQNEFRKRNVALTFLDDIIVVKKISSFKETIGEFTLRRGIILIDGQKYFSDPRSMDYDRLSIELKTR